MRLMSTGYPLAAITQSRGFAASSCAASSSILIPLMVASSTATAKVVRRRLHFRPGLFRDCRQSRRHIPAAQIGTHHLQQWRFVIDDQDSIGGSGHEVNRGYDRAMKFYTEYLTFRTAKHREYLNITPQVESVLRKSGIQEGMILVSAMHITAGVWVNDAEDGLIADIDEWLEKLAPFRPDYRHHRTGETNGDSHLKSLLVHHEVIVPVTAGKLDFGPWQQVYYAEFDGQRPKRVIIKVMGE